MKFRLFLIFLRTWPLALAALLVFPVAACGEEADISTFWPVFDYRRSPAADYTSLNLLGPLFKYERKGAERALALRPFYYRGWDPVEGVGFSEILYPVGSNKWSPEVESFQGLRLLQSDFGQPEMGSRNEFMLFPFLFYGETKEHERYFALFPFGGKILDKLGRDEIRFTLFPLYSRTRKGGTTVTNYLWPVFSRTEGEAERGLKFWPLFGSAEKDGVYSKRFFLWPIFFREDMRLDSDNPEHRRAAFPFYVRQKSSAASATTVLWPFFSYRHDRTKESEEWNLPWPLVRYSRGAYRTGGKFLPFYADERIGESRKRWVLWPLYKIEDLHTGMIERRRHRMLYFLFSHLQEEKLQTGDRLKRVALWPLFTYEAKNGVASFRTLSLLEPFFPDNDSFRRNWAPLWHVYQSKRDGQGNEISSLLWNLYWKERQGEDLALELFPLFSYRREGQEAKEFRLLKGLVRYRADAGGARVGLLYLPWDFSWGSAVTPQKEGEVQ